MTKCDWFCKTAVLLGKPVMNFSRDCSVNFGCLLEAELLETAIH